MTDQPDKQRQEQEVPAEEPGPMDELEELTTAISRRLRRNQLFLERFMDEDFEDEEEEEDETDGDASSDMDQEDTG